MQNRTAKAISSILALVFMLTAAAGFPVLASEATPTPTETRIIVDQRGIEVEVPKEIRRLVALPHPLPSIIYSIAGSVESVVGIHPWAMASAERGMLGRIAPELLNAETGFVAQGFGVNIEELIKLNPDVVIQWKRFPEVIEKMERAGLPVIAIRLVPGCSQDNLEEWLRIVGELFGEEDRAIELIETQRAILDEVKGRVAKIEPQDRPSVFVLFRELRTVAQDHPHQWWSTSSGGINVARDIPGRGPITLDMEQILEWNPEVIFISAAAGIMPQDILENRIEGQEWSQVDAVKNGRVYKIPEGVFRWEPPNAERALLFKWAAQKYFPEEFADLDIKQIVREFYREFFEWELTDEELRTILHYDAN